MQGLLALLEPEATVHSRETDVSVASAAIAEIVEEKLVERWSELAEAGTTAFLVVRNIF